jgi:methylaspartate mutase epsilon subunit
MGQFPTESNTAMALINASALIANLVGADKIITKTVEEALGVPSRDANASAVQVVKYLFDTARVEDELTSPAIEAEVNLIESEVRSIMEAVFELPGEMFWQSVYRAFQLGYIDIPFAPHADNANQLISLRDGNGSIRISNPGNVPLGELNTKTEARLLASRGIPAGKTYQHLLADINIMA